MRRRRGFPGCRVFLGHLGRCLLSHSPDARAAKHPVSRRARAAAPGMHRSPSPDYASGKEKDPSIITRALLYRVPASSRRSFISACELQWYPVPRGGTRGGGHIPANKSPGIALQPSSFAHQTHAVGPGEGNRRRRNMSIITYFPLQGDLLFPSGCSGSGPAGPCLGKSK
ncbi:hypothetical protein BDY21DRAFT_176938 [Lineolata rhizophorae]|uniref:Uncharacterized protein n=1 Tax=Lineolata rhizophorae TaxID=578093 RepID=A0A6A6P6W1_9PEZI|nr:hypothetical protein BDY21DRAFT_176938 [Lineolata rhizophorae]